MNKTIKILQAIFYSVLGLAIIITALFMADILPQGEYATESVSEFYCLTLMELITIFTIPFSIWFFRSSVVRKSFAQNRGREAAILLRWGMLRLLMLGIVLIANLLLYWLFMKVAFGYMAIITFLAIFFVQPSKARCEEEAKQ